MKPRARSNEILVRRLLTGTAVLSLALASSASIAGPLARDLSVVAQAQPSAGEAKPDDKDKKGGGEPRGEQRGPAARPGPPQTQPAKPPAPPKVETPKVEPPKPAAPPAAAPRPAAPAAPPPAAPQASPPAPAKPVAPPAVQPPKEPPRAAPAAPTGPSSAPPKAETPKTETPKAAPAAPTGPSVAPPKAEAPKERTREAPKAETPKAAPPPAAQSPAAPAPSTAQPRAVAPSTAQPQQRLAPPAANAPAAAPAAPAQIAAPPPPTTTRNASEFLLKKGEQPAAPQIDAVRRERRESRDGDRTVYREPDRTIVRDGNRTFIRHNESNRFAIDARDVRSQRRDGNTVTIVERPNGVQIVTITDDDGDLIRRVRRENGREIIIIDNSERRRYRDRDDYDVFIDLPPPVIRIPRDRYIIDARLAPRDVIYGAFLAPPVMVLDRSYTLEQVRYSAPLRERMPRVDLDVNFDTGSWQLAPDQIEELAVIAEGIKRAIARNPREVFMIEGYTDAVGNEIDNLSLSDRRAEAVAVALTDEFGVPPENLVTQGYGEQYLKIDTQGPERANRRVAVRRITPLINRQVTR